MKKINMKRPIYLIVFTFLIIVVLSVVRVAVENSISTTGIELESLQKQIKTVKKQNALLKEQYLQTSALINLDSGAKKMGFVDAKTQLYLSTPLPLALRQ